MTIRRPGSGVAGLLAAAALVVVAPVRAGADPIGADQVPWRW